MRIAILGTRGIPARYGGFESFAQQVSVRLVERGHDVTVFCEGSENQPEQFRGVTLRYIKGRKLGALSTIMFDVDCLWKSRSGFDVVYMLGYGASAFCWLPRIFGTQVWINMDGLEWARAKWNRVARWYLRGAEALATLTPDRIIADATAIKTDLRSRYRHLPPCDVIPYGCEVVHNASEHELTQFGLYPDSYYLVVCRFEPENHLREIIEGFLKSKSTAKLVLVGDHNGKSRYARALTRYTDERLIFTGPVYDLQRIHALRYFCRAYLHGHSVGGTNPSLLEAMGCGNLVIAHDNKFNREVLGDSALFFSAAVNVCSLLDSLDDRGVVSIKMRAQVVERVRQFYTWEGIADRYCELLAITQSKYRRSREVIHSAPRACDETPTLQL